MAGLLDIYWCRFKIVVATQAQYRGGVVIWLVGSMLTPIIYLAVWSSIAESNNGGVGDYRTSDFATYYIALIAVRHFTQVWHILEFNRAVQHGQLSARLILPLHPIHHDLGRNIALKIIGLVGIIPAVTVLSLTFQSSLNPPSWALIAFVPALILAWGLNFIVGWLIAVVAFWTTKSYALNYMYFTAMLFFSGQIAPIALLPDVLQKVVALLPFRWVIAFPIELLLGRLTRAETLSGFVAQSIWLIGAALVLNVVWRIGIRRYSAVGS